MNKVAIYEVGPRDGLQNEKNPVNTEAKIEFVSDTDDLAILSLNKKYNSDYSLKIPSYDNLSWVEVDNICNFACSFCPIGQPDTKLGKWYKKMAKKLLEIQTPQGHWAMSLLGQKFYPTPETSGSSFFIYGLAWGINNGILDKATYGPAVERGWNAMVSHVNSDGMLSYVQPIGAEPGEAYPDKTEVYGVGAFLSAGSEIYKLYGGK